MVAAVTNELFISFNRPGILEIGEFQQNNKFTKPIG